MSSPSRTGRSSTEASVRHRTNVQVVGRYGARLSLDEYERRLVALQSNAPPSPSRAERARLGRAELDLFIDYRLGTAFPGDRRQALWAAQREVRRQWPFVLVGHLLRRLLPNRQSVVRLGPPGFMRRLYARILDEEDLDQFLGDGIPPKI